MKKDIIIIRRLRKQRYTYREIGERLGISKQRVHQLYKNYKGYIGNTKNVNDFRELNKKCFKCESEKFLEIHHKDGNRSNNDFSNLQSLCRKCHRELESFRYYNKLKPTERNRGKFVKCKECKKEIWLVRCIEKMGGAKFCSRKCYGLAQKGIPKNRVLTPT